jgi:HK97 family phage portal protein
MLRQIVSGLLGERERRLNAFDDKYYPVFQSSPTKSGISVTPEGALNYRPFYTGVRVIAGACAQLPLILYKRRKPKGKDRATDEPLYELAGSSPNKWQTHVDFIEMMTCHLILRGNCYSHIQKNGRGYPTGLTPLHPGRVETKLLKSGDKIHKFEDSEGNKFDLPGSEVLHVVGQSHDGVTGISPITVLKEVIGLGLALEEHAARLFSNGARPGGILEHPGKLSEQARNHLKASFAGEFGGVSNSHKLAVLEEGLSWKQVGLNSEDAQFLESRRFQLEEIAGALQLSPYKLGDYTRATNANVEQQALDFYTHSVGLWLKRWEEALNKCLLPPQMRAEYFFEFLAEGFLRGDTLTRYQAYAIARQNGWLSANDIRSLENMNPIDGGDIYLSPMNMVPTDVLAQDVEAGTVEDPSQDGGEPPKLRRSTPQEEEIKENFTKAFESAISKVVRRESKEMSVAIKKIQSEPRDRFLSKWEQTYLEHFQDSVGAIFRTGSAVSESFTGNLPAFTVQYFAHSYVSDSLDAFTRMRDGEKLDDIIADWELKRARTMAEDIVKTLWREA